MTTFRTMVELAGKTATGFEVPDAVVAELGSGKRPAVTVTVCGHSYPSTVAVMGGRSYSGKRRHTLAVEGAKTDATRQRRIAKAVEDLRAGKK